MAAVQRYLVMDTCAWLFHYGLGPAATVAAVRSVAAALQRHGYRLAYTSVTLREVRSSPRPEIARQRGKIIQYIRRAGVRVGAGYWDLLNRATALRVPSGKVNDAAIILVAAEPDRVWFGCDSWAARFALDQSIRTIYLNPNL